MAPHMRVTLVHNADAGDEGPSPEELRSLVENAGHDVFYCSLEEDWKRALDRPSDLVAVAGGDGAVCTVFAELATRQVPGAVIPVGSANNIGIALTLVDRPIENLVQGWATAPKVGYDLGEPGAFAESAGGGLFASLLEVSSEAPSGEDKIQYGLEILRELVAEATPELWEIELDGIDCSAELLAVEAMLIGLTGPNVVLAPLADYSDGLFDVVFVTEENRAELVRYVDDRLARRATRPPRLRVKRAREVVIRAAGRPLRVDDELLGEQPDASRFATGRLSLEVALPRA
jgi:diacylglycerol kinase (ATP)